MSHGFFVVLFASLTLNGVWFGGIIGRIVQRLQKRGNAARLQTLFLSLLLLLIVVGAGGLVASGVVSEHIAHILVLGGWSLVVTGVTAVFHLTRSAKRS